MTTRTNLRNWRQDAIYCITVSEKNNTIRAELEAISVGVMSRITLSNMMDNWQKIQNGIKTYMIEHDPEKGISTPQDAVNEAIKRFEIDKKSKKA